MDGRVLIGMLTSSRHEYCQEAALYCAYHQSHKCDVMVVDLDEEYDNYTLLKNRGYDVVKLDYIEPAIKRIANGWNAIRERAIKEGYDYILYIAADFIFGSDSVERMMSYDKDVVGFLCRIYCGRRSMPCMTKSGNIVFGDGLKGLDLYNWEEVMDIQPRLIKVHGCTIGLIKRKVFEKIPFRYCPEYPMGEDVIYWNEMEDNGFEMWCDTSVKITHLNIPWNMERIIR